ncbi:hypothetical protein Bpfe_017516 [Biomphalaria pfeifferi]|uniref:Uncharacterized protein n=1 Tax=Biomphalaria pfeifferi TaxID=112525 RepID=A0AAD8BG68_BIOPF|nr:hypothetical protein Bpfe_017516 [Biomphalaria pfeifferi]
MSRNVCATYSAHPYGSATLISLINKRSNVYKIGLAVSCVSFVMFFLGDVGIHSVVSSRSIIAKVFFVICLASYLVTLGVAVLENFRKVNPYTYYSRKLEISLLTTSILCTASLAILRATALLPFFVYWYTIIGILSILWLYIGFVLVLCGNKKPSAGSTIQTVQYTAEPLGPQNVAVTHGYGQPMFTHQYAVQTQPLLSASVTPQAAPPPYALPPSYPAPYMNQVISGYTYLPPASYGHPSTPLPPASYGLPLAPSASAQEYSHSAALYGPSVSVQSSQQPTQSSYGGPLPSVAVYNRPLPSAPHSEDKV